MNEAVIVSAVRSAVGRGKADGALHEVIDAASLTTRGVDEVHGRFELDANALSGTHMTAWRGPHCPLTLRVR